MNGNLAASQQLPDSGAESYRTSDRSLYRKDTRPSQAKTVSKTSYRFLSSSDSILTNPRISSAPRPRSAQRFRKRMFCPVTTADSDSSIRITCLSCIPYEQYTYALYPVCCRLCETVLSEDFKFDDAIES